MTGLRRGGREQKGHGARKGHAGFQKSERYRDRRAGAERGDRTECCADHASPDRAGMPEDSLHLLFRDIDIECPDDQTDDDEKRRKLQSYDQEILSGTQERFCKTHSDFPQQFSLQQSVSPFFSSQQDFSGTIFTLQQHEQFSAVMAFFSFPNIEVFFSSVMILKSFHRVVFL